MRSQRVSGVVLMLLLVPLLRGQDTAVLLERLRSAEPRERSEVFYALLSEPAPPGGRVSVRAAAVRLGGSNPGVRAALIETLGVENAYLREGRELDEAYSDYYGDLLVAVTALRDARAIPALVDAMGTGNLVMAALAEFGQPAAEAVLARLNAGRSRRSACVVLGRMLDAGGAARIDDPAVRARIEEALMNASKGFGAYVRLSALEALTHSDTAARRKLAVEGLQALAEQNGGLTQAAAFHSLRLMADSGGGRPTAVQELAIQALGAIARRPEGAFGPAAAAVLESLSREGPPEARKAAVEVLRGLERAGGLERLLGDPQRQERR